MTRIAKSNPHFKKAYELMKAFRNNGYQWFQVAEYDYNSFMIRHTRT